MAPLKGWLRAVSCLIAATTIAQLPQVLARREEFYSERKACPVSCFSTTDHSQWTLYSNIQRLTYCNETMLFEVSLSGDAPFKRTQLTRVRACTATDADKEEKIIVNAIVPEPEESAEVTRRSLECPSPTKNSTSVELVTWGPQSSAAKSPALKALQELESWVSSKEGCQPTATITFAYNNGTVVGYFAGERVDNKAAAAGVVKKLADRIDDKGAPKRVLLQHCNSSGQNNTAITNAVSVGVVIDTEGGFAAVQRMVRSWSHGLCVDDSDSDDKTKLQDVSLNFFPTVQTPETPGSFRFTPIDAPDAPNDVSDDPMIPNDAPDAPIDGPINLPTDPPINARQSECRWIRVEDNDGCGSLAIRCGITGANYMRFNPQDGHCANLAVGQPVCCSSGSLPDLRPKPQANGDCFVYNVQPGDACSILTATFGLKMSELFELNENTWGWSGCDPLPLGISICLSTGKPPMPAPVDNAVCGPTKPGSRPPRGDQTLSDLNPCLLRACCNIWGQCGTTADFCIETESETGAPGTAAPGTHGCVQNCGMDVVNNNVVPDGIIKLGYFEGWNKNRPCLHMDVRATRDHEQVYSHVHFSFAHISEGPNYDVVIPDEVKTEWERFVRIVGGPKKILAFGGWAFSAEPPTYHLFREATAEGNRARFAANCIKFAKDNKLDGIDFDWEYPGAPDIPGIPPGGEDEGGNYLEFLRLVKEGLKDTDITLSIAAPASFWYLKQFPIHRMHEYLDYIVYMTYDLHGQWDAGNAWSNPSCPSGSCLRSHVNWTETHNALAMVTKAGVPAHKILVGVSSYGRSFKMAQAGCDGPMCTFLGDRLNSPAKKGRCTDTSGYLANAEIYELIDNGQVTRQWEDSVTRANYLVYEGTEWVSYMDDKWRQWREWQAILWRFGGTIEWAIDLQEFLDHGGLDETRDLWDPPEACKDTSPHDTIEKLNNDDRIPSHCLPLYVLEVLTEMAATAVHDYKEMIDGDYDRNFGAFRRAVHRSAGDMLKEWALENADKYFDCTRRRLRRCCFECNTADCRTDCIESGPDPPNIICAFGNDQGITWPVQVPTTCPPERKIDVLSTGNITFTLRSDDEEKFYNDILENVGLAKEHVRLGSYMYKSHLPQETHKDCEGIFGPCVRNYYFGFPDVEYGLYRETDVPNPKDLVEPAVGSASDLPATLWGYHIGFRTNILQEDPASVVDAFTLPVITVQESVKAMRDAYDMGEEIREQDRINFILLIVQVVLFIVPFLGKLAGSIGAAAMWIRAAANIVGDVGLIGVDIYKITQAETDDERAMLGLGIAITGVGTLTNIPSMREAARLRKATASTSIAKISDNANIGHSRSAMSKAQVCKVRYA